MSAGTYTLADIDKPKEQYTSADIDNSPATMMNRYSVPGQGIQEFPSGSTDEQRFLGRFPQAKPVSSYKQNAPMQFDKESPEQQSATQDVQAKKFMEKAGAVSGALIVPPLAELAIPAAGGLIGSTLATGAGAGIGTAAGQAVTGNNPLTGENLKTSGINAGEAAGANLALGGAAKLIGNAISPPIFLLSGRK